MKLFHDKDNMRNFANQIGSQKAICEDFHTGVYLQTPVARGRREQLFLGLREQNVLRHCCRLDTWKIHVCSLYLLINERLPWATTARPACWSSPVHQQARDQTHRLWGLSCSCQNSLFLLDSHRSELRLEQRLCAVRTRSPAHSAMERCKNLDHTPGVAAKITSEYRRFFSHNHSLFIPAATTSQNNT